MGAKETTHSLRAFFQNLRAGGEVSAESVRSEVDGQIPDGGSEKAIDEVRERSERKVPENVKKAKRQRREGNAQM